MPDAPGAEAVEEEMREEVEPIFMGAHGVGTRLAGRIGRHASAYGVAAVSGVLSGLVSVAIFTRFLEQSEFGRMAVLATLSTVISLIATLGVMQGTMRRIYGTTGDDEVDVDDDAAKREVAADPRLVLSTGFAITCTLGLSLLLLAFVLRDPVADLIGGPHDATLILLAAGAGASGAVLRFSRNILRLQLRSGAYLSVTLIYSFAGIPIAVPLLEAGLGVEAILIGFIVANGLAALTCVSLLLPDLRPAVSLHEARQIMGGGIRYLPIVLSFQAIQLGDVLLVAVFGGFSQTGTYRVAQRIAVPVSYGTSVFQQSWGPLRRDMTQTAVERVDEDRAYTARLFTYYAAFVTALILAVAVFADQLVKVASGQFGEAAALVPLTALSVAGHGWFIFAYRNARMPGLIYWMVGLSVSAALSFMVLSVFLVPAFGAIGAPLAAIVSWGVATLTMLALNQVRGEPIPFEWRNLATMGGLAAAVWLVSSALPQTPAGTAATLGALLAWVIAMPLAGVVPKAELDGLGRFMRDASGIDSSRRLRRRIQALRGIDAVLVDEMVRRRRPPAEVAARAGLDQDDAVARTVRILRRAAGGGKPKDTDAELGMLLLPPLPRAERDNGLMDMANAGADPLDVDLLKRATAAATGARRRRQVRRARRR